MFRAMTSVELVKDILDRAERNEKKPWLSDKQLSYLIALLTAEGRYNDKDRSKIYIATICPDGQWRTDLTIGQAIELGEHRLKRVYAVPPPFYIRRQGFKLHQIIVK